LTDLSRVKSLKWKLFLGDYWKWESRKYESGCWVVLTDLSRVNSLKWKLFPRTAKDKNRICTGDRKTCMSHVIKRMKRKNCTQNTHTITANNIRIGCVIRLQRK